MRREGLDDGVDRVSCNERLGEHPDGEVLDELGNHMSPWGSGCSCAYWIVDQDGDQDGARKF